ncbi:hypothetical protein [Latilactobacillus fragifolii]|uniref:hypothetical protein n=1 Tax=Latilactobacillus fragifolii TaxID=2814244 RepID=UPI001ABB89A4|nr:hypothetical protein [Latilactobacillus fragifolii]
MTINEHSILAKFEHLYKKMSKHTYSLLIVKNKFNNVYNFFLEDVFGATWSNALGSVLFSDLDAYKNVLKKLLASGLPIEYRGFDN